MISHLTYKIVALSVVTELDPNECIAWAIEMLELGHETPHLLMLAAFAKSSSYFEIKPFVESAAQELGLEMKNGDAAVVSYCYYYIREISMEKNIRSNLSKLYSFCQKRDYEGIVYDFYLLHWAWDDIDYDDINPNHYWEGTNRGNIESTVVKVANLWIDKHKKSCRL